ncbi:MAG: transglutaminase family protein [Rhabdaerophilum sp.]
MQYEITLRLGYAYAHPVAQARHLLRLQPRSVPGMQRLVGARLDIRPEPPEREVRTDFFGNIVHALHFHEDHAEFDIELLAYVERQSALPVLDVAPTLDQMRNELAQRSELGPDSPLHFLGASPRIPDLAPFREFAMAALAPGMSPVEAMRALGAALSAHMTFDDEATDVDTPPLVAFEAGRGVCQDYSQIMIGSLRALGIPAGYVSGFLRTIPPPGQERLPGADAMHAWVRIWCGDGIGWLEYDPTNAMAVADDHILVGYGRDYADVAPIRGVSRMVGGQSGHHTVDVIPVG